MTSRAEWFRMAEVDPEAHLNGSADETSPLAGRVLLAKGIAEGVEPPEELEQDLLLKGRVHSIYGASGIGKTWVMLFFVKQCTEKSEKVVLFDAENGPRIISERLSQMDVQTERLDELLHYYPFPNLTKDTDHVASYKALLDEGKPALVIFDSLVNFLGNAGFEENSNDDLVKWAVRYTRPARERGTTVLLLDHVPHEKNHARGASRKKDEVDVMWALTNPVPFDRNTVGRMVLHREKDREGWLPESVGFSVGGTTDGFIFRRSEGTIEEPDAADGLTASERHALDTLRDGFDKTGATAEEWRKAANQATSTFYRASKTLVTRELVARDGRRYLPTPEPNDDNNEDSEPRMDEAQARYSHELPMHSHGSDGSDVRSTPITPTTLRDGSDGSNTENSNAGDRHQAQAPASTYSSEGRVDVAASYRRVTDDEVARIQRLIEQGMAPWAARDKVLGTGDPRGMEF